MKLFNRVAGLARLRKGKRRPIHPDFERCEERVLLTAYLVNSAANTNSGTGNDGTLRYVLSQLSVTGTATNTIDFGIGQGLQTINLGSNDLPAITKQVTIDGYTEPGASPNTAAVGTNATIMIQLSQYFNFGLDFEAGSEGSVVRGLSIIGGVGSDIAIGLLATNVTVAGDFIGIKADGTSAGPNRIGVLGGVPGPADVIGTPALADRNLISGNTQAGVAIYNSFNNPVIVQDNLIGTDRTGLAAAGTGNAVGVEVYNSFSSPGPIVIGGTGSNTGNVISGNTGAGVSLAGASNVVIEGNIIGLAANGSSLLGQGGDGILLGLGFGVSSNTSNTIGGTTAGAGNIVSGNSGFGIDLLTGAGDTGNLIAGNVVGLDASNNVKANKAGGIFISGTGNTVGGAGAAARNVVSGNTGDGIDLSSSSNLIVGNYIGTDATGATSAGNHNAGVRISGSSNTLSSNVVAGNTNEGMFITGAQNSLLDNLIGTNAAGNAALGNGLSGITLQQSNGNTLRGNTVSGSKGGNGIDLAAGAAANVIQGNFVGTDAAGGSRLPNADDGIFVSGPNNTIGGTGTGQRNVVSGNQLQGVDIQGATATGNQLIGNFIGTNASGTAAVGNGFSGVLLETSNNVLSGNVISGNGVGQFGGDGIYVSGSGTQGNLIQGNLIGTNRTGAGTLPNHGDGVDVTVPKNTVGGTAAGAGNIIAYNAGRGIVVDTGTGVAVLSNLIHDNTGAGIELLNGGNNNQIAPVLTSASLYPTRIVVAGTLAVKAGTSYLVQYFGNNPASDQGRTFLVSQTVSPQPADGTVTLSYTTAATAALPAGLTITAIASVTATPPGSVNPATGDTSPFSAAVFIINPFIVTNTTDAGIGSLRFAVQSANTDVTEDDTITFQIPSDDPNYHALTGSWTIPVLAGLTIDKPQSAGVQHTVVVDGLSQQSEPGSATDHPVIAVDPGPQFQGSVGLTLSTGGNTIGGLVTQGFPGDGIDVNSSGNSIIDDFIGTDVLGSSGVGNQGAGLRISGSSNTIANNVISGNTNEGMFITVGQNSLVGNLIGTNVTGTIALGNGLSGITLQQSGSNTIQGNIVSGNGVSAAGGDGIDLNGAGATANLIQGNFIGVAADGSSILGQGGDGIRLGGGSSGNSIVGTIAGAGNIISGNSGYGIDLVAGAGDTGNLIAGNMVGLVPSNQARANKAGGMYVSGTGNTVGGTAFAARNVISGNQNSGLVVDADTLVIGNDIGTDSNGAGLAASGQSIGITINGSSNTLGGTTAAARNIISGNSQSQVQINGSQNLVEGNDIGTDATGSHGVAGNGTGVVIAGAMNVVGVDVALAGASGAGDSIARNVISGNTTGVDVVGVSNLVEGNFIGTDAAGNSAVGNTADGVQLVGVSGNMIRDNLISGNNANGVHISGVQSTGNEVSGNTIGLDLSAESAIPNKGSGVLVEDAGANTIGGPTGSFLNVISGNLQSGVLLFSSTGTGNNQVVGNFIGTTGDGSRVVPNGNDGVLIAGSGGNTIGGLTSTPGTGPGNLISGNAQAGVLIFSPASTAPATLNVLLGNLIGTDDTGTKARGNGSDGIQIVSGEQNTIGMPGGTNVVSGNASNGVFIDALPGRTASLNLLASNDIGTDLTGTLPLGNLGGGVLVENASGNVIGAAGQPVIGSTNVPSLPSNVISANLGPGIQFAGTAAGNSVVGDYIGVTGSGLVAPSLGNSVGVYLNNATKNAIGGTAAGAGNIIAQSPVVAQAGNTLMGIEIQGPTGATGYNTVQGNLIGIDKNENTAADSIGVLVSNSSGNTIGGSFSSARNVISSNNLAGIEITGPLSTSNDVAGNFIGTNIDGSNRPGSPDVPTPRPDLLPTQQTGVLLVGVSGNTVGGASFNDISANLISGNLYGIQILGNASADTQTTPAIGANLVQGNKIGTDATGMQALPNFEIGVNVLNSASNAIGGNLISANGIAGIQLFGPGSSNNSISSNLIGGNAQGRVSFRGTSRTTSFVSPSGILVYFGLQEHGVVVIGASNNMIGSSGGNLVVGNIQTGVYIVNHDFGGAVFQSTSSNKIQNNSITTNGIFGVLLYSAPNNAVVTTGATRNRFSGNPVNIRNVISALSGKAPQPVPRSKLLAPTSASGGKSSKPAKTGLLAGAARPRVPELIAKGARQELVSHKPPGVHVRVC